MMLNKLAHFFIIFIIVVLSGCAKNDALPTNTTVDSTIVIGNTTIGDTTIIKANNITITFSKTDPCYPSSEIFAFSATSANLPNGATFHWAFGDGHIADGQTVSHGYNVAAPFVVIVSLKNQSNQTIQATSFGVKAAGQAIRPVPVFTYKQDFNDNPNYLTFNSASSVNHGSIVKLFWDWGDGTTSSNAAALTRHGFPIEIQDKNYPVKLTITTDAGCTADTTLYVKVPGTYNISGGYTATAYDACTNEYFTFTAQATNVPSGAEYFWHFSDGTGDGKGISINHSFAYMNDYDVILYIVLDGRIIYTSHQAINAKGPDPKPKASFYFIWKKEDANRVLVSFNSQSTVKHGSIDGFLWNFGNGTTNNDYNSYHEVSYPKGSSPVTYQVQLIVSGNGCNDVAYQSFTIPAK